jgi:plasmid stability protein
VATLNVENIPDDLYEALRKHARSQGRSIAAEVRALLKESIPVEKPSEKELERRQEWFRKLQQLRFTKSASDESFPTSVEMIREDRER